MVFGIWKISPIERQVPGFTLGETYPFPIVDPEKAARLAREKIWKAQSLPAVRKEAKRILTRLTPAVRWRCGLPSVDGVDYIPDIFIGQGRVKR